MKYISGLMDDLNKKFRLIFIPYLLVMVGCMVGYSLFNWYVYLRPDSVKKHDIAFFVFGSFIFTSAVVLIWLRPRLDLIAKDSKPTIWKDKLASYMFAILSICFTVMWFQKVVSSVTGKLVKVEVPSDIVRIPVNKYYTVAQFSALKQFALIRIESERIRKTKRFQYKMYLALPLLDTAVLTDIELPPGTAMPEMLYNQMPLIDYMPPAWLCIEMESESLKGVTEAWKINKRDEFLESSIREFYKMDLSKISYLERMSIDKASSHYNILINHSYNQPAVNEVVMLKAAYGSFEGRNYKNLLITILIFLISNGVFLVIIRVSVWDEKRLQAFEERRHS